MAIAAIVLLSLAVLGAIGVATWTTQHATTPQAQADAPASPNDFDAVVVAHTTTASRPVYRYSVIPGGAHNRAELVDAINRDGVVADHYRTLSLERVRAERLTEARQAYVSYRIGDRVYWTKHKVTLPAGEAILTDGVTKIRARCGNCISDEPQLPTADEEPTATEFDAMAPVVQAFLPTLVSRPTGVPGAPNQSASLPTGSGDSIGPLLPLIPFGLATATSAQRHSPNQGDPTPDVSGMVASNTEPEHHSVDGSTPGGLVTGGLIAGGSAPGGPTPGGLLPGGFIPGTLIPQTLPDGPTPFIGDDWTRDVPEQPAPIPEPSTIVLLGTGALGALWRGVRSKHRR